MSKQVFPTQGNVPGSKSRSGKQTSDPGDLEVQYLYFPNGEFMPVPPKFPKGGGMGINGKGKK